MRLRSVRKHWRVSRPGCSRRSLRFGVGIGTLIHPKVFNCPRFLNSHMSPSPLRSVNSNRDRVSKIVNSHSDEVRGFMILLIVVVASLGDAPKEVVRGGPERRYRGEVLNQVISVKDRRSQREIVRGCEGGRERSCGRRSVRLWMDGALKGARRGCEWSSRDEEVLPGSPKRSCERR